MESDLRIINENVMKMMAEVAMLRSMLIGTEDEEGELSDWAKDALDEARMAPRENFVRLEDLEREIGNGI